MTSSAHTAKCLRCGRIRSFRTADAANRAGAYGRICAMRVKAAAIAEAVKGFAAAQVDKARELIADGGLTPAGREHIWHAEASDGSTRYMVNTEWHLCECKAGKRALRCYHLLAALLTEAIQRLAAA